MDGISRSRGRDKEIPHGVLPMEQLVLTVSPNHVVCDVNFWYHRQLNHQQEASPRNGVFHIFWTFASFSGLKY